MQPTVINSLATVLNVFATLGVVIAVILLFGWIFKRVGLNQKSPNGLIKIISGLMISPREKIILIEVADQWVLVGISSGVMETLHAFPKTTDPAILDQIRLEQLNQGLSSSTHDQLQRLISRFFQKKANSTANHSKQSSEESSSEFADNLQRASEKRNHTDH